MYDIRNKKYCPKCGGEMQDLVLTSYPAIHISKCMKCGYTEEKDNVKTSTDVVNYEPEKHVIDGVLGVFCVTTNGEKVFMSSGILKKLTEEIKF